MTKIKLSRALVLGLVLLGAAPSAPYNADRAAVERAVLDYVEALYDVEPAKIDRGVHPSLRKTGFAHERGAYRRLDMTHAELRDLAAVWNADGRVDPRTAPKEIVIYDVLDQTATAKLTAQWGVDYLHLARYDGRWQIVNVVWQTPPPDDR